MTGPLVEGIRARRPSFSRIKKPEETIIRVRDKPGDVQTMHDAVLLEVRSVLYSLLKTKTQMRIEVDYNLPTSTVSRILTQRNKLCKFVIVGMGM